MQDVIKNKCKSTNLYAGLFITFMGGANEDLLRQIHESRKLCTNGVIIFDYAHLESRYIDTLTTCAFNDGESKFTPLQCNIPDVKTKHRRFIKFRRNKG